MQLNLMLIKKIAEEELSINIAGKTLEKFGKHYELLLDWNQKLNLTRITNPDEAAVKHYIDSLLSLRYIDNAKSMQGLSLLDVGTGAGFPGIIIKLCIPQLRMYFIESSAKKCDYLSNVLKNLDVEAEIINIRAEEYARQAWESFDYVTSRALAEPLISVELCVPFLKVKGKYIQLAGPSAIRQINELRSFSREVGAELIKSDLIELPLGYGRRLLNVYNKTGNTPHKYPRNPKKIKKIYKK